MRRFFVDKVDNMRDIGGYETNNHGIVKEGCIIRSNCVTNLADNEIKKLIDMNFATIIDLRSDAEILNKNGVFFNNNSFNYNHIALKGNGRLPNSKEDVLNTYIEMLDGKEEMKKIFDILASTKTGVIYYCNAGKDRTGVVTACLLKLLGVNNQDIVSDYLASGIFLKKMIKEFASSFTEKDILPMITPHYETMEEMLRYIDEKYGSIEGYLDSCNLSFESIEKIRGKYVLNK